MNYYHLVTRIQMFEGQIIDITGEYNNRLYDFWMKRENRTEDGKDIFSVLEQNDFSDSGRNVIYGYADTEGHAVRETITELVRISTFPEKPSRFKCLYACKNIEDALKWKENFESYHREVLQLIEISTKGPVFTGDAGLLPLINGDSFDKKMEQAKRYWSGELVGELEETLVGGKITVEKIIENYKG